MRAVFSGLFSVGNALLVADEEVGGSRWQCHVCYTWNDGKHATSETRSSNLPAAPCDQEGKCEFCSRAQHPEWLYVGKHEFQIKLGALVMRNSSTDAICIVVAIDFARKELELLHVTVKEGSQHPAESVDRKPKLLFKESVIDSPQIQDLSPLDASEQHHWSSTLSEHGRCKDCRRIFHISQGDSQSKYANEEILLALLAEMDILVMQKRHCMQEKRHELVLQTTAQLREKQKQIQTTRRQLEFLTPLFCPFCGWTSPSSETHRRDDER